MDHSIRAQYAHLNLKKITPLVKPEPETITSRYNWAIG
jgi:hypothetical protein